MDFYQGEANTISFTVIDSGTNARVDLSSAEVTLACKASDQDSAFLLCFSDSSFGKAYASSGFLTLAIPSSSTQAMPPGSHIGALRLKFTTGNVIISKFELKINKTIF